MKAHSFVLKSLLQFIACSVPCYFIIEYGLSGGSMGGIIFDALIKLVPTIIIIMQMS